MRNKNIVEKVKEMKTLALLAPLTPRHGLFCSYSAFKITASTLVIMKRAHFMNFTAENFQFCSNVLIM